VFHGGKIDCGFARTGHTMQQASAEAVSIERGLDMRQCRLLGLVENMLGRRSCRTGKMKCSRPYFDRYQAPFYQGLQGGRGKIQPAQDRNGQGPACAREFGKNCQLIVIQFRRPRIGHQHCVAHQAAGIARRSFRFAQQPFFAQHVGQQLCRSACGMTQRPALCRLSVR
jgi:hypothetical protein